ncbi:diheme cytochrome c [Sulfurospirillum sp. 1307]
MKRVICLFVLIVSMSFASGVKPVDNELYKNECASCHFAYQPGLLPARSWVKIMGNLQNHFKTDASLDKKDVETLTQYLVKNSSDHAMNYKRSRKITNSISKNETPMRITKVAYFERKHRELSRRMIDQKEVKSISNCTACHKTADKGVYSERYINVPNYGRVDD